MHIRCDNITAEEERELKAVVANNGQTIGRLASVLLKKYIRQEIILTRAEIRETMEQKKHPSRSFHQIGRGEW